MSVSPTKYKQDFLESDAAIEIRRQLSVMEQDPNYITKTSYSPVTGVDNDISFTEAHMDYLSSHPSANPLAYMSNLRLKTKISSHRR